MEALIKRSKHQRVISNLDYKRITSKMSPGEVENFKDSVSVIDSINGVKVASLFSKDESILDRAVLQEGISSNDYGKLSTNDKKEVALRGIRIDSEAQTVDVFSAELLLRSTFEAMSNIQKEEAIKTRQLVDKMPEPDLTRDALHKISFKIAAQTKNTPGVVVVNEDDKDSPED